MYDDRRIATTALVVEILIVGLEAELWLAMAVVAVFGPDWVRMDAVEGWEALVTILVLAGAYVLGIVIDRLADSVFRWLGRRRGFWKKRTPDSAEEREDGFGKKRLEVLHKSPGMAPFLEYQRSRLRVARGTLLNLVPATLSSAAFVLWGTDVDPRWLLPLSALALAALAVTAFAMKRIAQAYDDRLREAYEIVAADRDTPPE